MAAALCETDPKGNRRMVAARGVRAGELLLEEDPVAEGAASQYKWCGTEALWALLYNIVRDPNAMQFFSRNTTYLSERIANRSPMWTKADDVALEHLVTELIQGASKPHLKSLYLCLYVYNIAYLNQETNERVHAFYPELSFVNHSCAPSCAFESGFDRHKRLVALRDIAQGEELTFCYTSMVEIAPGVNERRAILRLHFGFECACVRCTQEEYAATHCAHCKRQPSKLLLCSRCRAVRYCNSTCQAEGWRAGHKKACKK